MHQLLDALRLRRAADRVAAAGDAFGLRGV